MRSQRSRVITALTGAVLLLAGSMTVATPSTDSAPIESAGQLAPVYAPPVEKAETVVMARGQTLGGILAHTELTSVDTRDFLLALREHMNPRRLMPGVEITLRRAVRGGATRSIDVQMNADTLVHLTRGELGWSSELRLTPVRRDTLYVAGTIDQGRTLFEALVEDSELDVSLAERYALVIELAQIYQYQIDFAHEIQPGDGYAFMYERDVRPDGSTRWHRILASVVTNRGTDLWAVHYDVPKQGADWFDPRGRSLRLAFSRYPLDFVRVTSSFSWKRYHPVLGRYRAHLGTDFGASSGTRVKATGTGTVVFAGRDGGYGNLIRIKHPGGYETRYAHLRNFARSVGVGTKVEQGDVIGYVGSTGLATGPHLHYEFRQHGKPLDPRGVSIPAAPPVPKGSRAGFERVLRERMAALESLRDGPAGSGERLVMAGGAAAP